MLVERCNMIKLTLQLTSSLVVASLLISTTAFGKDRSDRARASEDRLCPLDEPIRVASAQALSRYSMLSNCSDKIIVAPATDPSASRPAVRIIPQSLESDGEDATVGRHITAGQTSNAPMSGNVEQILSLRPASYRTPFDETIQSVALRHRIDPLLLHAVIKQESGYRKSVRSHAGAIGLMQIMPATGQALGVPTEHLDLPESNVDAGARLLRRLYTKYSGDFRLVLAAYNAGEGAVEKYGNQIPPYAETRNYVKSVLAHYDKLVTGAFDKGLSR
jgi:soluble lytic murein transglycosylase-like protein